MKTVKCFSPYFGMISKKTGSHETMETKFANKYVITVAENKKKIQVLCLLYPSLSHHDLLFLLVQLTQSIQLK